MVRFELRVGCDVPLLVLRTTFKVENWSSNAVSTCAVLKVERNLYVRPLFVNLLCLAGAVCSSFLIISFCLFQHKRSHFHSVLSFFPQQPLLFFSVFSAVGRSGIHIQPLLSEHWGVEVQRHSTDHNGWPIICSKEGGGWGVRWSGRLWGEKGSIHQSISNEGKNWSNSSRWKSCSAWGGLSALSVSRESILRAAICNSAPTGERLLLHWISIYNSYCDFCCIYGALIYLRTTFSK